MKGSCQAGAPEAPPSEELEHLLTPRLPKDFMYSGIGQGGLDLPDIGGGTPGPQAGQGGRTAPIHLLSERQVDHGSLAWHDSVARRRSVHSAGSEPRCGASYAYH